MIRQKDGRPYQARHELGALDAAAAHLRRELRTPVKAVHRVLFTGHTSLSVQERKRLESSGVTLFTAADLLARPR